MARDDPQFRIRLPAELKARVEKAAETNHRSLNAEIVAALEEAFPSRIPLLERKNLTAEEIRQDLKAAIKRINDPKALESLDILMRYIKK